jgi:C1A family cysteine protease
MRINIPIIFLLVLYISLLLLIIYLITWFYFKEKYLAFSNLTPVIFPDFSKKRLVNVPLTRLKSPLLKVFPIINPSEIYFAMYKSNILSPVRDQGDDCGSCWCFTTCDVISDRLSVITNGLLNTTLSVQQLLSCIYDGKRDGCNGGDPEEAFKWIADSGYHLLPVGSFLQTEYIQSTQNNPTIIMTPCINSQEGIQINPTSIKSLTKFLSKENIKINDKEYKQLQENIFNMKAELLNGGPFYCSLTIYKDFYNFSGIRVYESNHKHKVGGHAIEIIGYCDKNVDTRYGFEGSYWICRNSWGANWPLKTQDKGFFAIRMGVNECGVESRCGMADPLVPEKYNTNRKKTMFLNYDNFINNVRWIFEI